jgi:mxaJ protein
MSSPFLDRLLALVWILPWASLAAAAQPPAADDRAGDPAPLRVCADPDNLPYSDRHEAGFENRIADVVARRLHRPLQYHWQPQQRGFVRKTLGEGLCDVFVGVPADFDRLLTTRPYYRSSYVFAYRSADPAPLRSFDDPRLRALRIGVQLVGNDLAATPPGHALARAGAVDNVVGYTVLGDGPAASRMVKALAQDRLDAAVLWGPQAGWYARRSQVPLGISIAAAPPGLPLPFEFSIAMGVGRGERGLRDALDGAIEDARAEIDAILEEYSVPRTRPGDVAAERSGRLAARAAGGDSE